MTASNLLEGWTESAEALKGRSDFFYTPYVHLLLWAACVCAR